MKIHLYLKRSALIIKLMQNCDAGNREITTIKQLIDISSKLNIEIRPQLFRFVKLQLLKVYE